MSPCQAIPRSRTVNPSLDLIQAEVIAKIDSPDFRVVAQFLWSALLHDSPMIHDVGAVCYAESFPHVVVGDEDADSLAAQLPNQVLKVLYRQRIDPRKRLVQQNEDRLKRQRPRNLQPAPLATR